jgi:hypothetical protein
MDKTHWDDNKAGKRVINALSQWEYLKLTYVGILMLS